MHSDDIIELKLCSSVLLVLISSMNIFLLHQLCLYRNKSHSLVLITFCSQSTFSWNKRGEKNFFCDVSLSSFINRKVLNFCLFQKKNILIYFWKLYVQDKKLECYLIHQKKISETTAIKISFCHFEGSNFFSFLKFEKVCFSEALIEKFHWKFY